MYANYLKNLQSISISIDLRYFFTIIVLSFFINITFAENKLVKNGSFKKEKNKSASLPEPLTLEIALSIAKNSSPLLDSAKAEIDLVKAQRAQSQAEYGTKVEVKGESRWIEPSATALDQDSDDSRISLFMRKKLYDFGRKSATRRSEQALVKSKVIYLLNLKTNRQIKVMAAFFNVILADLKFMSDDEAMAVAYIRYDRLRARQKLGQISELELLKSQSFYYKVRTIRYRSDVNRRLRREILANRLNRPGEVSSQLVHPKSNSHKRKLTSIEGLLKRALAKNTTIKMFEAELKSAKLAIKAAKKKFNPTLEAELGAYDYNRSIGSRDKTRASVILTVPLWSGGAKKASVIKASAVYSQVQAKLNQSKLEIRIAVIELRHQIYVLKAKLEQMNVLSEYRDFSLDKNRALYEMDVRADLGNGMVNQSNAIYLKSKTEFDLTIAWAKLDALLAYRLEKKKSLLNSSSTKKTKALDKPNKPSLDKNQQKTKSKTNVNR